MGLLNWFTGKGHSAAHVDPVALEKELRTEYASLRTASSSSNAQQVWRVDRWRLSPERARASIPILLRIMQEVPDNREDPDYLYAYASRKSVFAVMSLQYLGGAARYRKPGTWNRFDSFPKPEPEPGPLQSILPDLRSAVPQLTASIRDLEVLVANALAAIGPGAAEAVPKLIDSLQKKTTARRKEIVTALCVALAEIGPSYIGKRASGLTETLIEFMLEDQRSQSDLNPAVIYLLGRMGSDAAAATSELHWQSKQPGKTAELAKWALEEVKKKPANPDLSAPAQQGCAVCKTPVPEVYRTAAGTGAMIANQTDVQWSFCKACQKVICSNCCERAGTVIVFKNCPFCKQGLIMLS